jgi:hypothetical protein
MSDPFSSVCVSLVVHFRYVQSVWPIFRVCTLERVLEKLHIIRLDLELSYISTTALLNGLKFLVGRSLNTSMFLGLHIPFGY